MASNSAKHPGHFPFSCAASKTGYERSQKRQWPFEPGHHAAMAYAKKTRPLATRAQPMATQALMPDLQNPQLIRLIDFFWGRTSFQCPLL